MSFEHGNNEDDSSSSSSSSSARSSPNGSVVSGKIVDDLIRDLPSSDPNSVTGLKTLDALLSLPMVQEAAATIATVHAIVLKSQGFVPSVYNIGFDAASTAVLTGLKIGGSTAATAKFVASKAPTAIESALGNVVQKAQNGVTYIDDMGINGIDNIKTKLPIVAEPSGVVAEKAIETGKDISNDIHERAVSSWFGQTVLNVLDSTLTLTEKPLALIGNVKIVYNVDEDEKGDKNVYQLVIDENSQKFNLNVYTFGLHGKLINAARYALSRVRSVRKGVRTNRNLGRKVKAKREKMALRKSEAEKERSKEQNGKASVKEGAKGIFDFVSALIGSKKVPRIVIEKASIESLDDSSDSDSDYLEEVGSLHSFDYDLYTDKQSTASENNVKTTTI